MATVLCNKCRKSIDQESALEALGGFYCADCADLSILPTDYKKKRVEHEEKKVVHKRDIIEKEMDLISEDDTRHIIVTTTDTIEGKHIIGYIDVISVQDIEFQVEHFDPAQAESQQGLSERLFRNSVEISLSKLKKRAYLVGADAIVGVRIDSSVDHQREGEYLAAVMLKINVSGTAVQFAQSD
jgi:uncharacterized protein YbjQ (UPF0145 family)